MTFWDRILGRKTEPDIFRSYKVGPNPLQMINTPISIREEYFKEKRPEDIPFQGGVSMVVLTSQTLISTVIDAGLLYRPGLLKEISFSLFNPVGGASYSDYIGKDVYWNLLINNTQVLIPNIGKFNNNIVGMGKEHPTLINLPLRKNDSLQCSVFNNGIDIHIVGTFKGYMFG